MRRSPSFRLKQVAKKKKRKKSISRLSHGVSSRRQTYRFLKLLEELMGLKFLWCRDRLRHCSKGSQDRRIGLGPRVGGRSHDVMKGIDP